MSFVMARAGAKYFNLEWHTGKGPKRDWAYFDIKDKGSFIRIRVFANNAEEVQGAAAVKLKTLYATVYRNYFSPKMRKMFYSVAVAADLEVIEESAIEEADVETEEGFEAAFGVDF